LIGTAVTATGWGRALLVALIGGLKTRSAVWIADSTPLLGLDETTPFRNSFSAVFIALDALASWVAERCIAGWIGGGGGGEGRAGGAGGEGGGGGETGLTAGGGVTMNGSVLGIKGGAVKSSDRERVFTGATLVIDDDNCVFEVWFVSTSIRLGVAIAAISAAALKGVIPGPSNPWAAVDNEIKRLFLCIISKSEISSTLALGIRLITSCCCCCCCCWWCICWIGRWGTIGAVFDAEKADDEVRLDVFILTGDDEGGG
jgi:hypothetical protein